MTPAAITLVGVNEARSLRVSHSVAFDYGSAAREVHKVLTCDTDLVAVLTDALRMLDKRFRIVLPTVHIGLENARAPGDPPHW